MAEARTYDQIMAALGSSYDPQVNLLRQQQNALPGQLANDEQQLGAKKDSAFEDIVSGARSRGLGFSGIPLGEQAKYASTEYAPALANLRTANQGRATSLEQAIQQINAQRGTQAQSIFENERNYYEQVRQFNESQAAAARQAASAASASPNFGSILSALGGGDSQPAANQQGAYEQAAAKKAVYNDVHSVLLNNNVGQLTRYWNAISSSAKNGNGTDQAKVQLLQSLVPGLFRNGTLNSTYLANLAKNNVKFYQ